MVVDRTENNHPHLELRREQPVTNRRPRPGFPSIAPPVDPKGHGAKLRERLRVAREGSADELGRYDERKLIKITLSERVLPEDIARASANIEVVSQEEETLLLAFASEAQLEEFEAKLSSLAGGEPVTYTRLLYALQDLDRWSPADRTGWALRRDEFPGVEPFVIDVELWPLPQVAQARQQRDEFEDWLQRQGGRIIDSVRQPHLTIYRIRCVRSLADDLLRYRAVRTVDLPPRIGLEPTLISTDVQILEHTPSPPDDAPGIAVLDSGLLTGHPILRSAVGDVQSFLPGAGPDDEHGHGTSVSGIALYDDIANCVENGSFFPRLRLFSGRVLDAEKLGDPLLIENQVEQAVSYFVDNYGCRIFNLSYGDLNKPYQGRHLAGLAVTLDVLSRKLDVLFVVPTGNYEGDEDGPKDWREDYPDYLTKGHATLIDPAPALNAITVGSLARNEQNVRWPNDPAYIPVSRRDQPSPFTRHGPSVKGAIKPDLVDYGGNMLIDARSGNQPMAGAQGAGELSTSHDFAAGRPFVEVSGTSFAAPRVTNAAACILAELPDASVDLCRALLIAHARTPPACAALYANDRCALDKVTGYGLVDRSSLYRSLDNCVTLWAEDRIENRFHHFYEIPIPSDFWQEERRARELTVALAYRPVVRTTRIDYCAANISFKLVQADSLDDATEWFNADVDKDTVDKISERSTSRRFSETTRSKGTVQASTWTLTRPTNSMRQSSWFVIVTRNDPTWGERLSSQRESYALTITLSDRLAQRSRLYQQVQILLRSRIRAKARGRAGR